jgi:hypothetical protein
MKLVLCVSLVLLCTRAWIANSEAFVEPSTAVGSPLTAPALKRSSPHPSRVDLIPFNPRKDTSRHTNLVVTVEPRDPDVLFEVEEFSDFDEAWHKWSFCESTEYARVAPTARHANEFYVVGETKAGESFVELWRRPRVRGGYFTEMDPVQAPLGVATHSPDTSVELEGGVFIQPHRRTGATAMVRSVLRGPLALGSISAACVEPEGRYLLIHRRNTRGQSFLTQLPLAPDAAPVDLVSSDDAPVLNAGVPAITAINFARQGRIFMVGYRHNVLSLHDRTIDGSFEKWAVDDMSLFLETYPFFSWTRQW